MSRTAWFDPPLPRLLAHRGLALGDAENGLAAFRGALAAGATHLETDARATLDGAAVLVHDPKLTDGRRIDRMTLAELRTARPGTCTVAEALAALPDARFNIDVKSAAAAAPVAAAIRAADARERVLVASFSGRRRRATVRRVPGVATSASGLAVLAAVLAVRVGAPRLLRLALRDVDAIQIPVRVLGLATTDRRFLAAVRRAGRETHFWTIDEPATARALLSAGADGIVSNRADLVAEVLQPRP